MSFFVIDEKVRREWYNILPYIFLSIIVVLVRLFLKSLCFSAFAKLLFCLLDFQNQRLQAFIPEFENARGRC